MSKFLERSDPTTYEEALPLVNQLARSLARNFPSVEFQDIEQELRFYLWRSRERMLPKGGAWINFELTHKGRDYCRKQRANKLNVTDQYFYMPDDVERALEIFFAPDEWYKFGGTKDDITLRSGQVIYANDKLGGIAMLVDMRRVWDNLALKSQQALFYIYGLRVDHERYAYEAEITVEVARKRVRRARDELTYSLNKVAEDDERTRERFASGPGNRPVRSNVQALAYTGRVMGFEDVGNREGIYW